MEFNERINIENYSHVDRRSSNSFLGVIRTVLIGMFFIGILVFILNSSHKYIKNYQEELKSQQLRNLEEMEVDWHMEFFNQKNPKNKSAEEKIIKTLQYEKIKFNENRGERNQNPSNNNNNNNDNENFNGIDKETDVIIADSFFANRTLMLRNSSKARDSSVNLTREKMENKENKFFLGNEPKGKAKGNSSDPTSEGLNDELNINNNKTNSFSSYYVEFINKFRKMKIRKNNSNENNNTSNLFDNSKKKKNQNVENEDEYGFFNISKLIHSIITKIDRNANEEELLSLKYLDYIDDLTKPYNKIYKNQIISSSNDDKADKRHFKGRSLIDKEIDYLNADQENELLYSNYQRSILQQHHNLQGDDDENLNLLQNESSILTPTKIPKQNSPYLPGQLEDKRSSIPYISYALAENLYSNNLLNKLNNFDNLNSNKNRISTEESSLSNLLDKDNINHNYNVSNENNAENITNKTLEDIRYEQLLQKYLENRSTEELIQISTFFDRVDGKSYEGKWSSHGPQGLQAFFGPEQQTGEMDLTFQKYTEFSMFITQSTTYKLRFLKGSFIDTWLQLQGFSLTFTNITMKDNTLTAGYSSFVEFGELFERKGNLGFCNAVFTLTWNNTDKEGDQAANGTDPNYLKNFSSNGRPENNYIIKSLKGSFKSNCKIDVSFELSLADEKIVNDKILNYSIVFSIFCIMQLFNTYYLSKKIDESNAFSNGISVFTIGQNVIWNCYACLFHFSMTVNFENFVYHFGIPSFLLFINFSIFELRLLTIVWKNQNIRFTADTTLMRRKLFRLYAIIYFSIFISIFFVMRFLFEKQFIFLGVFLTFLPQIGHNMLEKNRICMPLLNVFLFSLNKLFLPFYYRGCPHNFFKISYDYLFCIGMLVLSIVMVLFMYSQSIFGPRWFLPKKYKRSSERNFYKTKREVMLDQPNADQIDCVICLHTLLNNEAMRDFSEDFIGMKEAAFNLKAKVIRTLGYIRKFIFDFYVPQKNKQKKPFMKTTCNHFFHSTCLESWLNQKKECPTCRQEIEHF